ncbi:MAG: ISKra4 family transposase [Anaerolineae bacterium]|nr:MAG: ISKra4 family transposase [Anaerolineae bacterium]
MNPLKQIEQEVLGQAREWARRKLERRLQAQADAVERVCPHHGEPLTNIRHRSLKLRTVAGEVRLRVPVGYSAAAGRWVHPVREAWGLAPYQQVSPELQARLCHTATLSTSYEAAAETARCWDCEVSDDMIHRHVQQVGAQALAEPPAPVPPPPPKEEFSLVIMMDGWMVRERGPDWGVSRRRQTATDRLAWHEVKSAVIYRLEQRVSTGKGRGWLLKKHVVATPPETPPVEFGAAVQAEALRRGLPRAKRVYVVMDGAVWLWNLARDRFGEATLILDFHHAREHLMAVGQALHPDEPEAARQWVDPLVDQLKKGQEQRVVATLEELLSQPAQRSAAQQVVLKREVGYFQEHRDHIHYQRWRRGQVPCGSGAVESLGRQLQRRFRTCGQFWSRPGLTHLLALVVRFRNDDHLPLWN